MYLGFSHVLAYPEGRMYIALGYSEYLWSFDLSVIVFGGQSVVLFHLSMRALTVQKTSQENSRRKKDRL